jgi:hypothetical protein
MQPSMQKAGAGQPPFEFRTNTSGSGTYSAELKESPVGKWQTIFIVRHPSGDPTAMNDMEDALKANLS